MNPPRLGRIHELKGNTKQILPTVLTGYGIICVFLLIDNAPAEAFQGLTLLAVIVTIAGGLFLSAIRRGMRKPSQQYQYFSRADYPSGQDLSPQVPHSDAMDYASNPWLYGNENDPRSHAYHAKQRYELDAKARKSAYENQKRHAERTRELNKWRVSDE